MSRKLVSATLDCREHPPGQARQSFKRRTAPMKHLAAFENALEEIRSEGRYRVFIDVKRYRGEFPKASVRHTDGREQDVIVWCSNDYLGMGQDPDVIASMKEAVETFGAGSGGTRNISGTTRYHVD